MKKLILLFIVFGGIVISHAYTSVYSCTDIKDPKYTLWINIDHNSLHFSYGGDSKPIVLSHRITRSKNNELIHFFKNNSYSFLIKQNPKNPIDIQGHYYEGEILRYSYDCKLKRVYEESHEDKSSIPITWKKSGIRMLKFMEEVAQPWKK